jgi:hypothetical protein
MNAVPYRLRGHGLTGTATDYWHGHGLPQRAPEGCRYGPARLKTHLASAAGRQRLATRSWRPSVVRSPRHGTLLPFNGPRLLLTRASSAAHAPSASQRALPGATGTRRAARPAFPWPADTGLPAPDVPCPPGRSPAASLASPGAHEWSRDRPADSGASGRSGCSRTSTTTVSAVHLMPRADLCTTSPRPAAQLSSNHRNVRDHALDQQGQADPRYLA